MDQPWQRSDDYRSHLMLAFVDGNWLLASLCICDIDDFNVYVIFPWNLTYSCLILLHDSCTISNVFEKNQLLSEASKLLKSQSNSVQESSAWKKVNNIWNSPKLVNKITLELIFSNWGDPQAKASFVLITWVRCANVKSNLCNPPPPLHTF